MHITSLLQAGSQPIERNPATGMGKTFAQAKQNFELMSASLNQGDVSGAQSSFSDLKKLLSSAGSIGAANSVKNDFDSLGKALGARDVPAAQKEFTRLKTDVQAIMQPGHGHMPGLPTRLPVGGTVYQAGLSAARSIAGFMR